MEDVDIAKLIDQKINAAKLLNNTAEQSLAINKRRHTNERRMAWASLLFMMGIVLVAIFKIPPEYVKNYDTIFTNLFFALSGVVLGYMGFTTWGSNQFFNSQMKQQQLSEESQNGGSTTGQFGASNQTMASRDKASG